VVKTSKQADMGSDYDLGMEIGGGIDIEGEAGEDGREGGGRGGCVLEKKVAPLLPADHSHMPQLRRLSMNGRGIS
jgi:hypothetical protein